MGHAVPEKAGAAVWLHRSFKLRSEPERHELRNRQQLCRTAKSMAKINANDFAGGDIDHEVAEMPIPNPKEILTRVDSGKGPCEAELQHQVGLRARG